jgi:hypothetical protein
VPGDEVAVARGPVLAALAATLSRIEAAPQAVGPKDAGLVLHLGHNHQVVARIGDCGPFELWASAHGVAVRDAARDASSWAFVSTGVAKLRWPSLADATCAGGLVLAERAVDGVRELWVVDPVTGRLGSLRIDDGLDWDVDPAAGELVIAARNGGTEPRRIPFAQLAQELLGR